jgi:hypothetical protein
MKINKLCHVGTIKLAEQSKTLNIFARSNPEIVGCNPTRDMDVDVCLFYVVLCVGRGLS